MKMDQHSSKGNWTKSYEYAGIHVHRKVIRNSQAEKIGLPQKLTEYRKFGPKSLELHGVQY